MFAPEIRKQVDSALAAVRAHPLATAAAAGTLPLENAHRWVFCAGRESRSFPWILRELLAWSDNDKVRRILQENLDDELGSGDPRHAHFLHYLHLLDQLGVPRDDFDSYAERAGIGLALSLAFNVAKCRSAGRAIGYMLVNEAMTPVTYTAAREALTAHHPDLHTDFFDLHIEVDDQHVAALYEAVEALPDSEETELRFGIALGQRGMEILLDEAYGVFDAHTEPLRITDDRWNPLSGTPDVSQE
ncbi:pyrroloquinoline quinone (PQQ) biosynthesis protein C [Streptomyces sp. LBL]|uniref:iron-containing redox enzyme family protein n=1 Tax=Streptomyces sp. LBL TaxID=2940562 RepID=UPI002476DA0A|nr:iron-containing redox enzyme family protein [Streptomyces sp. LBL]MDH6624120.1 pyrroloquinoline quinone (PQQ) biosynthesis protein C [Streptomyces sp. LBL]